MNGVREFRETDVPECRTCGACCTGSSSDGDFVPVTRLDRKRLPTKYQKKLQDLSEQTSGAMQALGLKRFGAVEACIALKGTLGKDIQCDVYAQRPDFCRTFEKGSQQCHDRRRERFYITPTYTSDDNQGE